MCRGRKSGPSTSRKHASRPEAVSMDFMVRPQSNVDTEAVQAREKLMAQNQSRAKVDSSFTKKTHMEGKPKLFKLGLSICRSVHSF